MVRSLAQQGNHNFKRRQLHLSEFNDRNKGDNAAVPDEFTEVPPLRTHFRSIQVNGPAQNAEIEISREESQNDMIKKGELERI